MVVQIPKKAGNRPGITTQPRANLARGLRPPPFDISYKGGCIVHVVPYKTAGLIRKFTIEPIFHASVWLYAVRALLFSLTSGQVGPKYPAADPRHAPFGFRTHPNIEWRKSK